MLVVVVFVVVRLQKKFCQKEKSFYETRALRFLISSFQ